MLSSRSGMLLLPRELVDEILGYVENDTKTLKACRLLSRSSTCWTVASCLLVFKSLVVHIDQRGRSIDAFVKRLTASPHIGAAIENLRLQNARREIVKRPIDVITFQTIMRKLPHLKSLSLQHLQYGTNRGWPTREFELDSLSIRCLPTSKRSYRTFLEIVASLSRLGELRLQMSPFYGEESYIPSPSNILDVECAPIQTLLLDGEPYPPDTLICDSLRFVPGTLHHLSLLCGGENDVPAIGRVLQDHGPYLTSLELYFTQVAAVEPVFTVETWHMIDLAALHALTSLTLIVGNGPLSGITSFLVAMPVKNIRHMEVVCASPECRRSTLLLPDEIFWEKSINLEGRDWSAVDVACTRFPNLRSILLRWNPGLIYRDGPFWANEPDLQVRRPWGPLRRVRWMREFSRAHMRGLLRWK